MSLKKRILSFFTAFLMIFGSTPFVFENASAAVGDDAPANEKNIKDNEDGTYTISLSVTGATSSDSTTSVNKANVVLVVDTSNSMNGRSGGYGSVSRLTAEKDALTEDDGIIDKLVGQNVAGDPVKSDIIEVAIVNFGTRGTTAQDWTTSATTLKNTINSLETSTGTNWEEALSTAKSLANTKKTAQPNEDTFIIFLTDGEPTTHNNSYGVNTNYATEWEYAKDDARGIVTAGHKFYALFTWGSGNSSHYLSSLVQYAYTGSGDSNSTLSSDYEQYFTDASDTATLVSALTRIVNDITTGVGYTNIELTDGVTEMTHSNIKTTASGEVSGVKYYRSGGNYSTTANDGLGEEWADAPKATINENGEIDWDLDDLVLENGVTYTISFIVWPSQESLDLVADLNNGKVSYGSLSEDQKSQIIENGGKYTLKTNTDYPTLTYSTITTTTVNGQTSSVTSDPKTVNIENPDPVGLKDSKLTIEKLWEDGLDPTQRKDYAGKVVLDFYRGEEVYKSDITLNEGNYWKLANYIAIAPGIMVSSSSEAYDYATQYTDDSEYAILEEGHDYHFTEPDEKNQTEDGEDKGKHFNLTKADYHPMLVDGTLMNVFYHRNEDGKIVIDSMEELTELTATNEVKGGALIEKILVGNDEETAVSSSDTFKFNAELRNSDGTNYGNFTYRIYYGESNPKNYNETAEEILTNEDGSKTYRSEKKTATDSLSIELYGGDRVMLTDLRTGAYFWADEDDSNLKIGYEQLEETNQIVRDGGEAETDATTKEFDGKTFYAIEGNASTQYIAKNIYRSGNLEFTKTVNVQNGNEEQAKATEFDFNVNFYDKDGKKLEVSPDWGGGIVCENYGSSGQPFDPSEMTMGDGCKGSVIGLPAGATYEIIETEKDGFTAEGLENGKVTKTGTITAGETATESFVNTYNATGKAEITVIKQFGLTENPFWMIQDDFKFVLKDESGRQIGEARTIDKLTHSATFEIEIEKEGNYKYEVEELDDNFKTGVARKDNDTNVIVTFKATDNGKGELVVSDLTYKNSKDTIYNSYTVKNSLEDALKFKKVFSEDGADYKGGAEFSFTVSMSEGAPKPSNLNENGTFTLKNNEEIDLGSISFSETDIPAEGKTYTYTITESSENLPDGVSIVSGEVEITVNVKFNKETGKLDVTTNQYETEFVNIFQPTDGKEFSEKLEIEKAIKDLTNSKVDGEFSFKLEELKNDEYEEIETITLATKDLAGSAKFGEKIFEETGTHYYRISEIAGEANGFSYDDTVYEITVKVTEEDGKLVAEYSGIPEDGIKFTNVYEAEATKLNFGIYKEVDNLTSDAEVETFEFELKNEDGETIATTEIEGEGEGEFSNIEFTQAGTYTFTVSEVNTGAEYYEYDETVYEIIVSIVDENGKLKLDGVTILKSEEEVEEIVFINVYENPGRGEVEEEEEVVEENPYTNDNIAFFVSLYILSLIGFIGAVVYARKEV